MVVSKIRSFKWLTKIRAGGGHVMRVLQRRSRVASRSVPEVPVDNVIGIAAAFRSRTGLFSILFKLVAKTYLP